VQVQAQAQAPVEVEAMLRHPLTLLHQRRCI
jgi:hypothetical protein